MKMRNSTVEYTLRTGTKPNIISPLGNADVSPKIASLVTSSRRHKEHSPKFMQRKTFKWSLRSILVVILASFVMLSGGLLSSSPTQQTAKADGILNFNMCDFIGFTQDPAETWAQDMQQYVSWPGTLSNTMSSVKAGGQAAATNDPGQTFVNAGESMKNETKPSIPVNGSSSPTAYDMYGTALQWESWPFEAIGAQCTYKNIINSSFIFISNFVLMFLSVLTQIMMTIFGIALGIDAFTPLTDSIGKIVEAFSARLYFPFLAPIVMLSGLWVGWKGLVKNRASEGLQGLLWMFAAMTAAVVFFAQPAALMKAANGFVTDLTSLAMTALPGQGKTEDPLCNTKAVKAEENSQETARSKMARTGQCLVWETFYFKPWAAGQFGAAAGLGAQSDGMTGGSAETGLNLRANDKFRAPVVGEAVKLKAPDSQLSTDVDGSQNGNSDGVAWYPGGDRFTLLPIMYLQGTMDNQIQVIRKKLPRPAGVEAGKMTPEVQKVMDEQKVARMKTMTLLTCGAGGEDAEYADIAKEASCPATQGWAAMNGSDPLQRLAVAFLAILSLIVGALPLLIMATSLVFYQIMGAILWLVAPIYLTLGIHPGFGRKLAMSWLEHLFSNSIKRVVTGFFIGLTLILLQVFVETPGVPLILSAGLIGMVGFGMLLFRSKLMKKASAVNFGGSGTEKGIMSGIGSEASSKMRKNVYPVIAPVSAGRAAHKAGLGLGDVAVAAGTAMFMAGGRRGGGSPMRAMYAGRAAARGRIREDKEDFVRDYKKNNAKEVEKFDKAVDKAESEEALEKLATRIERALKDNIKDPLDGIPENIVRRMVDQDILSAETVEKLVKKGKLPASFLAGAGAGAVAGNSGGKGKNASRPDSSPRGQNDDSGNNLGNNGNSGSTTRTVSVPAVQIRGADGRNGQDGRNGVGIPGQDGQDGKKGERGESAGKVYKDGTGKDLVQGVHERTSAVAASVAKKNNSGDFSRPQGPPSNNR